MTLITTLANTQNVQLVESEYGHKFFIEYDSEAYLGMLPSDEIQNAPGALHACKCEKCGTVYVTQRQSADKCPACTGTVAPLVGEAEFAWVQLGQMESLYGLYEVKSQILSPTGEVLASHSTFEDDEIVVFENEMYDYLYEELLYIIERSVSIGLKPTDGSKLRLALMPCYRDSECRLLAAWAGPAWYGFAYQWLGDSGDGDGLHWSCSTEEAYCATLQDLASLLKGWSCDSRDLLWVGKLGYEF